jgi:hypothetical protein
VSIGLPPSLSILLSVPLLETIHSAHKGIRPHIVEMVCRACAIVESTIFSIVRELVARYDIKATLPTKNMTR